jgi:hypothetical protein
MARVAILGWGSLLWEKGTLQVRIDEWHSDGPWLPIEFARRSNLEEENGKGPYLSLVLDSGAAPIRTYWNMSLLTDHDEACADLRRRERCNIRHIASLPRRGRTWSSAVPGLEKTIQEWLALKSNEIDAAIWTNLPPKPENVTPDASIQWLDELRTKGKGDTAQAYIQKAPPQTDTYLRRQVRERFGWTDIPL